MAAIMVDNDDEYYFKNFIDTLSEEESDDDFFTDAALLIHEHIVSQIPVFGGPWARGRLGPKKRGTTSSTTTTSNPLRCSCRACFAVVFG
ncbi:hypothetical protein QYE76_047592 [Lolium multiflorum]|uniref:Uncharacterized protein n=1 Tax=Lolium multiflorum TaxID=4521 RepID=A0AAD8TS26_LOLMU|nr:hypothetical protein QYE76_047592 [Lolium multiflorum]